MPTTLRITKVKARILLERQLSGMTQTQIAAACNMHYSRLSEYALDKRPLTQDHLDSLCRFFQLEPDQLSGYLEFTFPED